MYDTREILALHAASTQGEWYQDFDYADEDGIYADPVPLHSIQNSDGFWVFEWALNIHDAAFIAAAKNHIPAMCAEIEGLRAALDKASRALADLEHCTRYPGFTCDADWPAACPACIQEWLMGTKESEADV